MVQAATTAAAAASVTAISVQETPVVQSPGLRGATAA